MKAKLLSGALIAAVALPFATTSDAQMAETGLKNKGKAWDRSVEATTKMKKETSENAGKTKAVGDVMTGTSDGPDKKQEGVDIKAPPADKIKQVGTIKGEIKAVGGIIDGDSDGPNALTDEEIKMLTSNGDIVICGKTGEIVGTKEWKKSGAICKRTGYKIGSPRDQLILLAEQAGDDKSNPYYLTPEELKLLKSNKDVQLSGKTGEIIGLKGWDKKEDETSKKYGFNKQSPRYIIIKHYQVLLEKSED